MGVDNVSAHMDTSHMIREGDDMGEAIRACGDRLGYFHACASQQGVEEATLRRYVGAMIYRESPISQAVRHHPVPVRGASRGFLPSAE